MSVDVLLVTSWDAPCGIAEHAAYLKDAVMTQSDLEIQPLSDGPSKPATPEMVETVLKDLQYPIVHLNYHAALHSAWVPEWIPIFQKRYGVKVVITFHDTGVPNSPLCKALHDVADVFVIHEPADDLPRARYIRMGVPEIVTGPYQFGSRSHWMNDGDEDEARSSHFFKAYDDQPVLGSVGFAFPWKHYDQLAKLAGELGWAFLVIAPQATQEQIDLWRSFCPDLYVYNSFLSRITVQSYLRACDATAFTYVCHNTGQSAAILQGIGARKPVIALSTCRQFRALGLDKLGSEVIRWCTTFEQVAERLRWIPIQRVDPGIVALAEQESWTNVGQQYIEIYRSLL